MNTKKYIAVFIIMLLLLPQLSGCDLKEKVKLNGGDLINYSFCLEAGKEQLATCPIITTEKISEIALNNYVSDDKDALEVTLSGVDMNDYLVYEGYYVYFPVLKIACMENERSVDTSIEKILFEVDGKVIEYITPNFDIQNVCSYIQSGICESIGDSISISGDYTAIYGYVPDRERTANLMIQSSKDLLIKEYIVSNCMDIDNLIVKGILCDSEQIEIEMEPNVDVEMVYTVNLDEKVSENTIVRSSQIIVYESEGTDYMWVYSPGLYIWKNYENYGNIKCFIDQSL